MDKTEQDKVWITLPAGFRKRVKWLYNNYSLYQQIARDAARDILETIFGHHNLTSDNNRGQLSEEVIPEQSEPKFRVGDLVKICNIKKHKGGVPSIVDRRRSEQGWIYKISVNEWVNEARLEPYAKPEDSNVNQSQEPANCDNSEDKELNLRELLKGHEGEEFFLLSCGNAQLDSIAFDKEYYPFEFKQILSKRTQYVQRTKEGKVYDSGVVDIYPSRTLYEQYPLDAKKAWAIWIEQQTPKRWRAKNGEEYYWVDSTDTDVMVNRTVDKFETTDNKCYELGNYFRTKEDAEYAAKEIRKTLDRVREQLNEKEVNNEGTAH